jgi:trehalose-6-phosphate synthase
VHDGVVISRHGRTRAAVFPIGIDPEQFAQLAAKASTHPDVSRLRRSLNGEKLAIGVDRLDYSKGLINRIKAFDRMWTLHPQLKRAASLLQIANALARRDRGLRQSAERGRQARQRRQRPARRGRLDADPLSQQGLTARPCSRASIAPRRSAW